MRRTESQTMSRRQKPHGCGLYFLQAEDGIRYLSLTGVQTCALPISGLAQRDAFAAPALPQLLGERFEVNPRPWVRQRDLLERHPRFIRFAADRIRVAQQDRLRHEIGRASCRERV